MLLKSQLCPFDVLCSTYFHRNCGFHTLMNWRNKISFIEIFIMFYWLNSCFLFLCKKCSYNFQEDLDYFPKGSNDEILFSEVDYVDTWKALEACVKKGLTKSIGLSNFNKKQIERVLEAATIKPAMNQVSTFSNLQSLCLFLFTSSLSLSLSLKRWIKISLER